MFGCVSGLLLTCQLLSFCWVLSWLGTESSSLVPNNAHSVLTSADLHHIRLPFALEPWPELLPACLDHCPVSSSPVAWFLLNSTEPASGQYTRDQDPPVSSRPGREHVCFCYRRGSGRKELHICSLLMGAAGNLGQSQICI